MAALQSTTAAILLALDRSKAAASACRKAFKLAPMPGAAACSLARMLKIRGRISDAVRVMEGFVKQGDANYAQMTEYGQRLLEFGDFEGAARVLDHANAMKAKPSRQVLRDLALRRADDDFEAGMPGTHKRDYLVAMDHLVFERPALAEAAFLEVVTTCPAYAPAWLGLRGARHALGHADATEATERQCRAAPGHPPDQVIQAIMARPLSRRGLVFDPDEPIKWRAKDESFVQVQTAADLRATENSQMELNPGELVQFDPVVLFGPEGRNPTPPAHLSREQYVLSVRNAAVVGHGQVLTEANALVEELASHHASRKYNAWVEEGELRFDSKFFRFGMLRVRCFDHPAILLAGPIDNSSRDWINNFVPKLGLAKDVGLDCRVLVNHSTPPQFIDMLAALGIERERVIFHDPHEVSIFPKLYAPSWTAPSRAGN